MVLVLFEHSAATAAAAAAAAAATAAATTAISLHVGGAYEPKEAWCCALILFPRRRALPT